MMATYLINNLISTYSTAKPVHEKLNVKRRLDEAYQTDINNLSSGKMSKRHRDGKITVILAQTGGHKEQVEAAMAAFFAQQFAAPQPAAPKPGEYDPEAYRPKLEFVENPFGEGIKQPPGLPHLYPHSQLITTF